ncbi:MAG: hypothetical protein KY469_11870 [Actinobacteria bacterium]|nr:hypothetical protein [Actinomycetota bacterium]
MTGQEPSRRRLAVATLLAAVLSVAAVLPGAWARSTYGNHTSGDEPHYLLTAISLGEDASLDVRDEVADERYRPFHEQRLKVQAAERDDGTMVVPHDPLLPALLAGPVRLGGWLAAKLALALVAGALAALLVWTGVRRFHLPLSVVVPTVVLFVATAPLAAYGTQVYPELPAALAVTVAAAALLGPFHRGGQAALVLAAIGLPWLSVKYVPVAAVLVAIGAWQLHRRGARRALIGWSAMLALVGLTYAVAHLAWYGGWTVYASGEFFREAGGELTVVGTRPRYAARSQRLIGLLVDRHFGLAAWQPAWLAVVPALAALARSRPRGWAVIAAPTLVGWLVATFVALTMHGWWFPGRQVVVVLPLLVLAIAWWAARSRVARSVVWTLGAFGAVTWAWFLVSALNGDVTVIVDFAAIGDPIFQVRQPLLPDYVRPGVGTWVRHGAWIGLAVAVGAWSWRRPAGGRGPIWSARSGPRG